MIFNLNNLIHIHNINDMTETVENSKPMNDLADKLKFS